MILKAITVKDNGKNFRYEILVERWEDVVWIARRGTDGYGRKIVNMEIEGNGMVYTNTVEQVTELYKDVELFENGHFAFEVIN